MTNYPYVVAALAVWTLWGISWVASALWTARRTAGAPPSTFRLQLGLAFLGYALLFCEAPLVRHPLWLVPAWLGWGAVIVVAASALFAWWARIHLGDLWSAGIVTREGHRVVDSGPYALVRHPIYTAIILGGLGLAVVKATPLALVGVSCLALGFGLKARVEERFLTAELGENDYAAYRRRVPMLVPFAPTSG